MRALGAPLPASGMSSPISGLPGGCQGLPSHTMEQEILPTKAAGRNHVPALKYPDTFVLGHKLGSEKYQLKD